MRMRSVTIRNVPDDLYRSLVRQAERNRRSLQQQVLLLLERARSLDHDSHLKRASSFRARLEGRDLGDSVTELREDRSR